MITKYDIIIPVAKKDIGFVHRVLQYIRKNLIDAETVYLITNEFFGFKEKRC